jgi:hypothetical protein
MELSCSPDVIEFLDLAPCRLHEPTKIWTPSKCPISNIPTSNFPSTVSVSRMFAGSKPTHETTSPIALQRFLWQVNGFQSFLLSRNATDSSSFGFLITTGNQTKSKLILAACQTKPLLKLPAQLRLDEFETPLPHTCMGSLHSVEIFNFHLQRKRFRLASVDRRSIHC